MPLYPLGYEAFNLRGYDLVVTSDSGVAKGVLVDDTAVHLCYCHSPMRALYDQYEIYKTEQPAIARALFVRTAVCDRRRRARVAAIKKMAGKTIEFIGHFSEQEKGTLHSGSRAFLFAANEDFGIAPVEAQSYGRPVIALQAGGALETVIDGKTGLFFPEQNETSAAEAILRFEGMEHHFSPLEIREHSLRFDTSVFCQNIRRMAMDLMKDR